MSLLNILSFSTEKIIWKYHFQFNNIEKKIKEIINCHFLDNFEYNNTNLQFNLLDFLEIYSEIEHKFEYKKRIRLKFRNPNDYSFDIDGKNVNDLINHNKNIFNIKITQIVKLYHSDTIYILI